LHPRETGDPGRRGAAQAAGLDLVDLTGRELAGADAVAVLTGHDAFDYRLIERAPYVFDTRNRCSGDHVERI
jgi:hypothetical protein